MLDREYVPAPCRVLYSSETGFAPDAPDDVKARQLTVPCAPEPPRSERPPVMPRENPQKVTPRPKVRVQGDYRPRFAHVTIEKIRFYQRRKLGVEAIAALLKCHPDTVYARIREANGGATRPKRKLTPEQQAEIVRRRNGGEKGQPIAEEFGISRNRVYELCKLHAKAQQKIS